MVDQSTPAATPPAPPPEADQQKLGALQSLLGWLRPAAEAQPPAQPAAQPAAAAPPAEFNAKQAYEALRADLAKVHELAQAGHSIAEDLRKPDGVRKALADTLAEVLRQAGAPLAPHAPPGAAQPQWPRTLAEAMALARGTPEQRAALERANAEGFDYRKLRE